MTRQLTNLAKRTLPFGLRLGLRQMNWQRMYALQRRSVPGGHAEGLLPGGGTVVRLLHRAGA